MWNVLKRLFKNPESSGFREAFDQSIDAIIEVNPGGDVIFFNNSAQKLWGYSQDEIFGKNIAILFEGVQDTFISNQLDMWKNSIQEMKILRKGGDISLGSMSLSKITLGGGFVYSAIVRDATEIQEERERYVQILGQAVDAVVSIDENNCVTFYNAAAEHLFGYSRDEVMGQNVKMLCLRQYSVMPQRLSTFHNQRSSRQLTVAP